MIGPVVPTPGIPLRWMSTWGLNQKVSPRRLISCAIHSSTSVVVVTPGVMTLREKASSQMSIASA